MAKAKPRPAPHGHHDHHVGDPIVYHAGDGAAPEPGQIRRVGDDGHTCSLIAYCPDSGTMRQYADVPHADHATDPGEPHFHRVGEAEADDES